ncbi:MAG: ribonuclease HI family protein [Bacillota bacterium]
MKLNVYIDGASRGNPGPAAAAMVLQDESGKTLLTKSKFLGVTTNNVAEWSALEGAIRALVHLTRKCGNIEAVIYSDSKLVVEQFNGQFKIRNSGLKEMAAHVKELLTECPALKVQVIHISREKNRLADQAANAVLDTESA